MSSVEVALATAFIALGTSILGIVLSTLAGRAAEFRSAHRKILAEHVSSIAEALHEIVATSAMLCRANSEESQKSWRERSGNAQAELKSARRALRYPLWGLDHGLRELSRLPDWIDHVRTYPKSAEKLLDSGASLSKQIDKAIRQSYLRGRAPTWLDRWLVDIKAKRFRALRDSIMAKPKEERE